jgi:hypothetical protein
VLRAGSSGFLARCVMTYGPHLCLFREMRLLHRTVRLSLLLSRLSRSGTPHSLRGPSPPSLGLDCTTVSLRVQVSRSTYADTRWAPRG